MNRSQNWRDILAEVISDPIEKAKVASALGVHPITLIRWIRGESKPRYEKLTELLELFPGHRIALYNSFLQDFPNSFICETHGQQILQEIPSYLYAHTLKLMSNSPSLGFWPACKYILEQMLQIFDPYNNGTLITLARPMPKNIYGKRCSLYQFMGVSSSFLLEEFIEVRFWGRESLAGNSAITGVETSLEASKDFPLTDIGDDCKMGGAIAYPICRGDSIAGVLFMFSLKPELIFSLQDLGKAFCDLFTVAFSQEDFYPFSDLLLGVMPSFIEQRHSLDNFHAQVISFMEKYIDKNEFIDLPHAEEAVMREIEKKLLKFASDITNIRG